MPRTPGHITEQRPGVYRIRVSAGTNPITGKRRQLSQTVHGIREDAERALQTLLRDVQNALGALFGFGAVIFLVVFTGHWRLDCNGPRK